jgi:DNA invertase Pin-like site-specific DNA recombinase
MRVCAYLRVSTDEQAEQGLGLDVQEQAIRAWAREHKHRVTAWHRDEGISGSNGLETRLALADALTELRRMGRRRKHEQGGYAYGAPPLGFTSQGGELVPDDAEQATIRRVRELHAQGRSLRAIADTLDAEGFETKRGRAGIRPTIRRLITRWSCTHAP